MEDKLVTIASFTDYIEAEMAQQLLADYGIKAIVTGQNASNVYPIPAIEGPELQVLQSQAGQARQILESQKKNETLEDDEDSAAPTETNSSLMEQEQ